MPLRIAAITASGEVWGAERKLLSYSDRLRKHDIAVVIHAPEGGTLEEHCRQLKIPFVPLDAPRRGELGDGTPGEVGRVLRAATSLVPVAADARRLGRLMRGYDVAWSFNQAFHLQCALAGRLTGTPVVLDLHDVPTSRIGRLATRIAVALSTCAVAVSGFTRSALRLKTSAATIVHTPLDENAAKVPPASDSASGPSPVIFGVVGQVAASKGVLEIGLAISCLRQSGLDVQFLIIGGPRAESPQSVEYARSVEREMDMRLQGAWHLTGWLAEPFAMMQRCDVVINFSKAEPAGRSIVEAQALGIPVVVSANGGSSEYVGAGAGVVVSPADLETLTQELRRLALDSRLRADMGNAGKVHARAAYSLDYLTDRYAGILRFTAA